MHENDIAREIVDASYTVHTKLGPGLLESVYEIVLEYELRARGLSVVRQQQIPLRYESLSIENAFRADLIVGEKVIVEIKSVETLKRVHSKQLLTYLKLTDLRLGLLINFGSALIKNGINRVVNKLQL